MATFAHDQSRPNVSATRAGELATVRELAIAQCRFRDISTVAALHRRCFRKALAYRTSTLLFLRLMPRSTFLVARVGDQIVGNVIGDVRGGQSRVISICVDPDWRQQGIGAQLLNEIEAALPVGNMILMVEATNTAAHLLYRSHGYLSVGESRDYYGRGKHGIWMQKNR